MQKLMKRFLSWTDPFKAFAALLLVTAFLALSTYWLERIDADALYESPSLRYVVGSSADACPFACIRCTVWDPNAWPKNCVEYRCLDDGDCGDPPPPPPSPPTASASLVCGASGASGWCIENGKIRITASDPAGGTVTISGTRTVGSSTTNFSCGNPCDVNMLVGEGMVTYRSTSSASGLSSSNQTIAFKFDNAKPDVVLNASGDQQGGWYRGAVISMSASDNGSGIQSILVTDNGFVRTPPFALTDGMHDILATVTDRAGNVRATALTIKVDSIGPEITTTVTGLSGENGWWLSDVGVNASAIDTLSGLASLQLSKDGGSTWLSLPQSFTDGEHSIFIRARDAAGNTTLYSRTISIDTIKPTLSFSTNGSRGAGGWYVSPVTIDLSTSDSGSGVTRVEYRMNGSGWIPGSSISAIDDGVYNLEFRVVDAAGNEFTLPSSLRVDTKPPVIDIISPSSGAVVDKTVRVNGTSLDETSGVDVLEISMNEGGNWQNVLLSSKLASLSTFPMSYESTWVYNFETSDLPNGEYDVQVRAADKAGNVMPPVSVKLLVNNQGPLVDLTDAWQYMEAGQLNVQPNFYQVSTVSISIHDGQGNILWSYTGEPPQVVSWNGKVKGELMSHGDYPVVVLACDVHGVCSEAQGVVTIPFFQYAQPEPTEESTPIPVVAAQPVAAVETPAPDEPKRIFDSMASSGVARSSAVLAIAGIFLFVFASQTIGDPRPSAAKSLSLALRKNILSNKE
jgi:hypothetical protein